MSTAAGSPAAGPGGIREVEEQTRRAQQPRARPRDRADRRQHHRRRHLQPAGVAGGLRADQPRSRWRSRPIGALALALHVRRAVPAAARRRRPVRLRPRRVRQPRRLLQRLAVLDHRLVRATRRSSSAGCSTCEEFVNKDQNKLFSIVLALIGLWIPAAINLSGVRAMGAVQLWTSVLKFIPLVFMSHGRAVLHQQRELRRLEHQRREHHRRDRRGHGAVPVLLPRRRDGGGRGREGARPRQERPAGHDLRHPRHRGRLPAVAHRGVRHRLGARAVATRRAVRHRGQRDLRRHVGRLRDVRAGRDLRLRRAQRLDDDLRRDAAGRGQGRAVPAGVREAQPPRRAARSGSSPPPRSRRSSWSCPTPARPASRCSTPWSSCRASPPPSRTRSPRSPRSSGGSSTTGSCTRRGSCATSASPSSAWSSRCCSSVLAQHRRGHPLEGVPAVHLRRRRLPGRHPDLPQAPDAMSEPPPVPAWRP